MGKLKQTHQDLSELPQDTSSRSEQQPTDRLALARTWLPRLLQAALFMPLLLIAYRIITQQAASPGPLVFASAPEQRILVVHNSTDVYGEKTYANAVQALDYARLQHDDFDLASGDPWPELSGPNSLGTYSALLFSTELLGTIGETEAQQISDYVADGGGLVVAYRAWSLNLATLFGIETEAEHPALVEGEGGLQFHTDFFPGIKGLVLSKKTSPDLSFYKVQLRPEARIIASSGTGKPITWLHHHGQGRVLYWNTAFLVNKEARGLIIQSVMNVQSLGVLPIANFATMQVDDFPSALSTEKAEPLKAEYDMTMVEFYEKVWFPDMMDIAQRYGIVYTFMIPFNFNSLVEPPFDFREWEHATIEVDKQSLFYSVYVSHLAAQQHELGLHGYNHVSLTLENWGSEENMVKALQAVYERWEADNLGDYPITYAPPNNIYDEAGIQALTESFPSLKVLACIYTGRFEDGGDREFEPEPWNPQLFDIPRVTFGYNMSPHYRYAMVSELGMMGIWTPFIHPDDVVHTPSNYPQSPYHRNPNRRPWRGDDTGKKNGLYYRFLRLLDFVQTNYPWLRYVRTDESYDILRTHLENQVTVDLKPHEVVLHSTSPTYFQVRINDGRRIFLNDLEGAQFVHVHHGEGYTLYTLRGVEEEVRLRLLMPTGAEEPTPAAPPTLTPQPASDATDEDEIAPEYLQNEDYHENLPIPVSTPGPTPTVPLAPPPTPDFLPTRTPTPES